MVEPLAAMIAPARTALVIIDVQVDFAAPEGMLGREGVDVTPAARAIDRIEALIAAGRVAGVPVAFLRVMTSAATDSAAMTAWMARRGTPGGAAICRVGGGGEDFHRIAPQPGDIAIEKPLYDGFHGTGLDVALRARGIDTLVLAGLTTDCCVDSTARGGFERGYHIFVAADGCAAFGDGLHENALDILARNVALLVASDAVVHAWSDL